MEFEEPKADPKLLSGRPLMSRIPQVLAAFRSNVTV
jgi:hypothetical protein